MNSKIDSIDQHLKNINHSNQINFEAFIETQKIKFPQSVGFTRH